MCLTNKMCNKKLTLSPLILPFENLPVYSEYLVYSSKAYILQDKNSHVGKSVAG